MNTYSDTTNCEANYEYSIQRVKDRFGATDTNSISAIITELASKGWRLHSVFTNELGKNALSVSGIGVNSTSDEVVLIFERIIDRAKDNFKTCPFCAELIKKAAVFCRYCGQNVQEYDVEQRKKEAIEKENKKKITQEKYKTINDLLNDTQSMKEITELGRIYGFNVLAEQFNKKAKELLLIENDLSLVEIKEILENRN